MSTDNAPLPEAVREQIEALIPVLHYVKGIQHTQSLDDFYRMHLTALWEAAAQQERARLADIFDKTDSGVWRAHEVRDFLLSQNMAHPPPTPEAGEK